MAGSSRDSAPIDFDVLDDVRTYLARSDRFEDVDLGVASRETERVQS